MYYNTSLDQLLKTLSNRELAFFYTYRSSEFMPASRDTIQLALDQRKLSAQDITAYINQQGNSSNEGCPRCNSHHFLPISETELRSGVYSGYEVEIHSKVCRICGYTPNNHPPINWKTRLKKFFGKYAWKRLK